MLEGVSQTHFLSLALPLDSIAGLSQNLWVLMPHLYFDGTG